MKLALTILACAIVGLPCRARVDLEGQLETANGLLFLLKNEKGQFSGWRSVGETFDGFRIVAFDSDNKRLLVEKGGNTDVLPREKRMLVSDLFGKRTGVESRARTGVVPIIEIAVDREQFFTVKPDAAGLLEVETWVLQRPANATTLFVRLPYADGAMSRLRQVNKICTTHEFRVSRMTVLERTNAWSLIAVTPEPAAK